MRRPASDRPRIANDDGALQRAPSDGTGSGHPPPVVPSVLAFRLRQRGIAVHQFELIAHMVQLARKEAADPQLMLPIEEVA
jgi:hypothetical protein